MSYIGNQSTTSYTSMTKQDITGNGGASYTLSHAVSNVNEIAVYVNNVRQEPTSAYTVNGTALNMTGNVASSDDFYVIYLGKAIQTVVPPDGSVGTAKIANSAVDLTSKVTGVLPVANGGTGVSTFKVDEGTHLQTSSNTFTQPAANDTWTDFTDVNVSITPSSTSSKILIITNAIGYARATTWVGFRLLRDSTVINTQWTYIDNPSYWSQASCNIVDLDTPNTTSSITYKIQMYADTNNGSLRMQHSGALNGASSSGTRSTIVALEVAR